MSLVDRIPRFRVRRTFVVALLLVLALGFAAALGIQAYGVSRYHRRQADRVLRDYAALAAARVASRTQQAIYFALTPPLKAIQHAHAISPGKLPAPNELHVDAMERVFPLTPHIRFTFRMDLVNKRLETAGELLPAAVRSWLVDTLPLHARSVYDTAWHMGDMGTILGQPGGDRRYVAYTLLRDKKGVAHTALGFEATPAALRPLVIQATEKNFELLPRPLTGGVQYDSMGSFIITDRFGVEIYRSAVQYTSPFTARDTIGTDMGDLYASATLRASVADKLIIGGLPKSRLPLILGLLGLTAALIGTALFQLRRESQLARLRTDFISGVSHELRTPLAQIRMFSGRSFWAAFGSMKSRRSLAIIDQEARRLTHLVENLLHFSRSERQTTHIAPEPTALAPLVREVIDGFAPLAAARGARLSSAVPEDLVVPADPGAVRQMLLNLLDNAVKYGPAGQEIRIGATRENGIARLWVDDGGPGIPRADRERVWDRFWRLERDRGSAVAGSGIGLAVVRELAVLHHGKTWIDDTGAQVGTRVVIELPA
jgi:signal transduction histidine kinase